MFDYPPWPHLSRAETIGIFLCGTPSPLPPHGPHGPSIRGNDSRIQTFPPRTKKGMHRKARARLDIMVLPALHEIGQRRAPRTQVSAPRMPHACKSLPHAFKHGGHANAPKTTWRRLSNDRCNNLQVEIVQPERDRALPNHNKTGLSLITHETEVNS